MTIVVLNAGSGSLRCSLFRLNGSLPTPGVPREPDWETAIDSTAPGPPEGWRRISLRVAGEKIDAGVVEAGLSPHDNARRLLEKLWTGENPPLTSAARIDAVAHRVVHGADRFERAVRVDAAVEEVIALWSAQAPLHNPASLDGIRAVRELLGDCAPQLAVFDTAFHRTLPEAAATYAGPYRWREMGIRRYGFHGTNFRWVAERAARLLGRTGDPDLRLVLCHLGSGCSLCATRGGRSVDTTMGFTPLDGIAMSTRPGALDPGILLHLQRLGGSAKDLEQLLQKQCGLRGLSGISGDTRELTPLAADGDRRARLALDVFIHRLRAGIGQMLPALDGRPDAIVFTDAIAEDEPELRAAACAPFAFLGLQLDPERNRRAVPDAELSREGSVVRALLVKSREAWQIARECHALLTEGNTP